jgi:hypothetical protein
VGFPPQSADGHPVAAAFRLPSASSTATGASLANTGAPLDDEGVLGLLLVLAGIPVERLARRGIHQLKEA